MSRRTVVYLGILAVLVVLTVVKALAPTGPAPIAFKVPAIAADAVKKIVLTSDGEAVVIEHTDRGYQLTSPLQWPADQAAAEGVVKAFEKAIPMDFLVSEKVEEQEAYELTDAQALKVEIFTGADVPEVALYVGKNGPMGTNFVRPVGSAEIYRAKVGSVSRFKKPAADWRDKRVVAFEADAATGVRLAPQGGPVVELAKEGDAWVAREPAGLDVDQNAAAGIVRGLANLRASEIVEGDPADTGLDAPSLEATVTLASGEPVVVRVGAEKEAGARWVGRSTDAQRFVVRDSALTAIRKTADELRDKTLLDFKPEQVLRITASEGAKKVVIEAGEGQDDWRLVEGQPGDASAASMRGILSSLGTLRAVTFQDGMSAADAGIETDGLTLHVELEGGATARLSIGKEAAEGQVYAQVDGGPVTAVRSYVVQNVRKLLPAS